MKIKESKKRGKYLDLARSKNKRKKQKKQKHKQKTKQNAKKLWNMEMTMIPTVVSAPGTILKGLVKMLEYSEIRG